MTDLDASAPRTASDARLEVKVDPIRRWDIYRLDPIGQITLQAGQQKIALKANGQFKSALMDLRELRLTPAKR